MAERLQYDEPFLWWGPVWSPPPERTVLDLIRDGALTPSTAALLWAFLQRRASVVVVAGPRGAGKTTLLTALLDLLPEGTRRLYLRGCYEPFTFLDDSTVDPRRSVLLVNEISAHLPAYLWGPGVGRLFAAARWGYAFAATAHATTVEELIGQLAGYPLRVPLSAVAAIDLVVGLEVRATAAMIRRRVTGVWSLREAGSAGIRIERLAADEVLAPVAAMPPRVAMRPIGPGELTERGALLADLALKPPATPVEVRRLLHELARTWEVGNSGTAAG